MIFGSVTIIVTSSLMGVFSSMLPVVAVLYALKGFLLGAMFACAFALTGDVVDYGEWKYGVRSEGLVMSGVSIGQKAGLREWHRHKQQARLPPLIFHLPISRQLSA